MTPRPIWAFGDFELDLKAWRLSRAGRPLLVEPKGPPARPVLDSGSDGLVIFGHLARQADVTLRHHRIPARIESVAAARSVSMIPVTSFRSGRLTIDPGWAALLPEIVERSEDGLLPLARLGPVMLSVSERLVIAGARLRTRACLFEKVVEGLAAA